MPGVKSRLSDEARADIKRRAESGERYADIARDHGITASYVSNIKAEKGKRQLSASPNRSTRWLDKTLPVYDPAAVQVCTRWSARLSVAACGARSRLADKGDQDRLYAACKGCEVGQANARGAV